MFRYRLNELCLTLDLMPQAPLLVKAGEDPGQEPAVRRQPLPSDALFDRRYAQAESDIKERSKQEKDARAQRKEQRHAETGNISALRAKLELDMRFVTTWRNGQQEPYLPGSGIKGAWRSYAERFARSTLPPGQRVCDPFEGDGVEKSCTQTVEDLPEFSARYAAACRICQLFGCGGLAGRLAIADAYLLKTPDFQYNQRSGVGVDRQRGAAHEGTLFFYQVLESGVFRTTVTLENFELWQLGLLAHVLEPLYAGNAALGYGVRRGLGRLKAKTHDATLTYFGASTAPAGAACQVHGIAALARTRGMGDVYGFIPEPVEPVVLPGAVSTSLGLRQAWSLPSEAQQALWQAGAAAWRDLTLLQEVSA